MWKFYHTHATHATTPTNPPNCRGFREHKKPPTRPQQWGAGGFSAGSNRGLLSRQSSLSASNRGAGESRVHEPETYNIANMSPPSGVNVPDTTPAFPAIVQDQVVATASIELRIRYAARIETAPELTAKTVNPVGAV